MAEQSAGEELGRVTLVTGPEEFLAERAVGRIRGAVRATDPEAELSETTADQLSLAGLGELSAPSLFSSTRCVVVRRFEDLPEESVEGIVRYAGAPAEDVALVLVHSGGQKGSGVLAKLRKLSTVSEVRSAALNAREYPGFVVQELRAHRVRIDPEAAAYLVQSVGQDLRALASACDQLASDAGALAASPAATGSRQVTVDVGLVKQYFGGRAEAKSFQIADHVVGGEEAKALEELRWGLNTGLPAVLVTSAVAGSLRQLARLGGASPRASDADLARTVGAPPWKVRILRAQLRGWEPEGLAAAVQAVARADADVKGQVGDAAYALERMVMAVTRHRAGRGR